jgi:hypothetical protein
VWVDSRSAAGRRRRRRKKGKKDFPSSAGDEGLTVGEFVGAK